MDADERGALRHYGWMVASENPLEIEHGDGSTATGQAAYTVINDVVRSLRESRAAEQEQTVPAEHFSRTLNGKVDNPKPTDEEFREFVRNTLPIVKLERKT